ncbi:MAG: RHS repeat-associated core domain-containing protein, partial [Cryomorphaceae bacterium]|nr:RHS repeat-associated core domain-containing protein [Cryomorphaceae bacterium]
PANQVTVARYQYSNHLGSAALELNEAAEIISYQEYHPFGSTSYELHTNDSEVSLKRYQYVGKERDGESGLYYYGARYYADWLCRFVSVDPLKDDYPYYTTYQYAGNKPITSIDVDGLEAENQVEEEEVGQQKNDTFSNFPPPMDINPIAEPDALFTGAHPEEVIPTSMEADFKDLFINLIGLLLVSYLEKEYGANISPDELRNMSEDDKEAAFNESVKKTISILLYEFATGRGEKTREFYPNHAITRGFYNSKLLRESMQEFYNFNKDNIFLETHKFEYKFSPTSNPFEGFYLVQTFVKHAISNQSEKLVGGVWVTISPNDEYVDITIKNTMNRKSLLIHAVSPVEREDDNLTTLGTTTQFFHLRISIDFEKLPNSIKSKQQFITPSRW